jgi:hypothetical protein
MAALPSGTILPWYGKKGRIPNGWAVCNGENGTPNLQGRYMRGSRNQSEVGTSGGTTDASGALQGTVGVNQAPWKGSDANWGQTPWANGPNPAVPGSYPVSISGTIEPPYVNLIFIMKL